MIIPRPAFDDFGAFEIANGAEDAGGEVISICDGGDKENHSYNLARVLHDAARLRFIVWIRVKDCVHADRVDDSIAERGQRANKPKETKT